MVLATHKVRLFLLRQSATSNLRQSLRLCNKKFRGSSNLKREQVMNALCNIIVSDIDFKIAALIVRLLN
jgi:hypothetical protein